MSAQIVILSGPDAGTIFNIAPGQTLHIGRSAETDTRLNDGTVSRLHCDLIYDGSAAVLENHSAKGTLLNGVKIAREAIRHGDIVQIGGTEFRFQLLSLENSDTLLQALPNG